MIPTLMAFASSSRTSRYLLLAKHHFVLVHVVKCTSSEASATSHARATPQRSLTDKLARDFFTEPSQASISCALTKTPSFDPSRLSSSEGKEVFAESKGINFIKNKTLR